MRMILHEGKRQAITQMEYLHIQEWQEGQWQERQWQEGQWQEGQWQTVMVIPLATLGEAYQEYLDWIHEEAEETDEPEEELDCDENQNLNRDDRRADIQAMLHGENIPDE